MVFTAASPCSSSVPYVKTQHASKPVAQFPTSEGQTVTEVCPTVLPLDPPHRAVMSCRCPHWTACEDGTPDTHTHTPISCLLSCCPHLFHCCSLSPPSSPVALPTPRPPSALRLCLRVFLRLSPGSVPCTQPSPPECRPSPLFSSESLCDGASDGFLSEPGACWVMLPPLLRLLLRLLPSVCV